MCVCAYVCVCMCSILLNLITLANLFPLLLLRHVHTNPLKCALDQIALNHFEPIRIRSVHTLVTESEFDYGLRNIFGGT